MKRANADGPRVTVAIPWRVHQDATGVAARARASGCAAVELGVSAVDLSQPREAWDARRAILNTAGLQCVGLALETEGGVALASVDAPARAVAREQLLRALHGASWMGAQYVRLSVTSSDASVRARQQYEDVHHHVLEALTALRHEAGLLGQRIAIEVGARGFLTSPAEARAFVDAVNSPWVGAAVCLEGDVAANFVDWIETLTFRLLVVTHGVTDAGPAVDPLAQILATARYEGTVVASESNANDGDKILIQALTAHGLIAAPV